MADCSGLITNQDLENAKQNADTYKVVIESDLPTTTTPDGKTIFTLVGLNQQISFIYPPILWQPGLVVDNALQLYEVPPSASGDTGSFLVFPFVENLPFTTGINYDPSKWTVLQYSKENLDQAVAEAEAQAQAAASSASQAANSAQSASDEADRAEQAVIDATLNSGVYETVADGILGTSPGDLFNVISSQDVGFVDLYLNDLGVGVYQGKTSPDVEFVKGTANGVRELAGTNKLTDIFSGTDFQATNLTDATPPSFSVSYTPNGAQIQQNVSSRLFYFTTDIVLGGNQSNVILSYDVSAVNQSNYAVGFYVNETEGWYYQQSTGRIVSTEDGIIGTPGSWVANDSIEFSIIINSNDVISCDVSVNGTVLFSFSKGGISKDSMQLLIANQGVATVKAEISSSDNLSTSGLTDDRISDDDVKNIDALPGLLEMFKRATPPLLTNTIDYEFRVFHTSGTRSFFTDVNLKPIISSTDPSSSNIYVDPILGDDLNSGSIDAPKKSILSALTLGSGSDKFALFLKPELYDIDTGWGNAAPQSAKFQVLTYGGDGDAIVSNHYPNLTWSLSSGQTWVSTPASFANVVDFTNPTLDGDFQRLTQQPSVPDVDSNPNSYFWDGTDLYVNTFDGRQPDNEIRVYSSLANARISRANGETYMENIQFHGSSTNGALYCRLGDPATKHLLLAKNCQFNYCGSTGDGLDINGAFTTVLQGCMANENGADGFNYHEIFGSPGPNTIEVDCIGRGNGYTNDGTNNGSTMHDPDSIAIRVNGQYYNNEGRNIHDINGSQSWNLGCISRDSKGSGQNDANWVAGQSGEANQSIMYLDTCDSSGSGFDLGTGTLSTIYIFDLVSDGNDVPGSDIQNYQA